MNALRRFPRRVYLGRFLQDVHQNVNKRLERIGGSRWIAMTSKFSQYRFSLVDALSVPIILDHLPAVAATCAPLGETMHSIALQQIFLKSYPRLIVVAAFSAQAQIL